MPAAKPMKDADANVAEVEIRAAKADMEANGVACIRALFDPTDTGVLRDAVDRYISEVAPGLPPRLSMNEPGTTSPRCIYWMNIFDPFFADLLEGKRIQGLVRQLLNWEPRPFFVEAFMKPAQVGSRVPMHQDLGYSRLVPPQQVTVWIALDASTAENAGVRYMKGSHKLGLLPHVECDVFGSSLEVDSEAEFVDREEIIFTLEPGDAVIHDGLTAHYSPPNTTARARRGLAFGFRGVETAFERFNL